MNGPGEQAVAYWDQWVTELEEHALDPFEYEALLAARAQLPEALEIAGSDTLWARADAIDARFTAITLEVNDSPFASSARDGWWWQRLPADEDFRSYAVGET